MSDDNTSRSELRGLLSSSTGRGEDNMDSLLLDEKELEDVDIEKNALQDEFELRIKCNSPGIEPPNQAVTGGDWYCVTTNLGVDVKTLKHQVRDAIGETARGRYLRLIAKGRLLAPDSKPLKEFQLKMDDYIHAVVAPVGVRGGQQAVMAQADQSSGASSAVSRRVLRSVGVDSNGLVLSRREDDSDTESSEGEDVTATNNSNGAQDIESGNAGRRSRRSRERRGFDRLRNGTAPGLSTVRLTRDEVAAIRLYFRRSVDQFAERRRRRERRQERRRAAAASNSSTDDGIRVTGSDPSADGVGENVGNRDTSRSNEASGASNGADVESGNNDPPSPIANETQRRRERYTIEEEWMAAQGSMSEFRMNLSTNHTSNRLRIGPASIFDTGSIRGADRMGAARGNNPLASSSVGTDRDFMWGFFMGFFVGFVMLFWVWLPTVSHKQKIGILAGISCQLGFNMLNQSAHDKSKSNSDADPLIDGGSLGTVDDPAITNSLTEAAANSSLVTP